MIYVYQRTNVQFSESFTRYLRYIILFGLLGVRSVLK